MKLLFMFVCRRTHLVPTGANLASPYPESMTTRYGSYQPGMNNSSAAHGGPAAQNDLTAAQTSAAAALVGGSARLSPAGKGAASSAPAQLHAACAWQAASCSICWVSVAHCPDGRVDWICKHPGCRSPTVLLLLLLLSGALETASARAPAPVDEYGCAHALYLDLGDLNSVEAFAGQLIRSVWRLARACNLLAVRLALALRLAPCMQSVAHCSRHVTSARPDLGQYTVYIRAALTACLRA